MQVKRERMIVSLSGEGEKDMRERRGWRRRSREKDGERSERGAKDM